uniref:Uncharacterized protein n=1 Tax=Chlamydomonas leiostraca TaxID=1034604 RepID=A0A7S0RUY5_9CHLO|mmetsp:Transcript_32352/g.82161  ORF Transcript_32352/g.82161 Transcript_32352/m.82161 type:complete len:288 (+) Transcript_32352:89-952(+)
MSRAQNVVYLDGRLLDGSEPLCNGVANVTKPNQAGKPSNIQNQKSLSMAREARQRSGSESHGTKPSADERMPSAISGVSLAPLPDSEVCSYSAADPANAQHANRRRPPRVAIPHGPPGNLRPIGDVPKQSGPQQGGTQELRAEGRALTLAAAHDRAASDGGAPQSRGPSLSLNLANLSLYAEINGINDQDSICGTPPALPMDTIARVGEFDFRGPLGPLSPTPLSPSVLTVTKGNFNMFSPNTENDLWGHNPNLPDMRHVVTDCTSPPALVSCVSPPLPLSPPVSSA